MYWHVAWLQMDGLGDTICSPSLFVVGFPSQSSQAFWLFTLPFMFSLSLSLCHVDFIICFDDLCLSSSLCLSFSADLFREGTADWKRFIVTPASVLRLAQSWHPYTRSESIHTHREALPVHSLLCWLLRCPRYQSGARTDSKHSRFDMVDISCAF